MENNASAALLAQYQASGAGAALLFQAHPELGVEITRIVICNTTASPVSFSLFHDDSGSSTFDATTALVFAKPLAANDFVTVFHTEGPNGGLHLSKGAQLGFTDPSSGDLTVSVYGITQVAPGSASSK